MKNRVALWMAVLLSATPALSQPPDSAEALQRFLQDALSVARSGNNRKLAALVKEMEIPNDRAWFTETYGPAGRTFADAYEAKLPAQDVARLHMLQLTARSMKVTRTKTVLVRRINDAPYPGDPFEANAVRNLRRPVNIFFAYYNGPGAPGRNPIGYFVFVDGKFRWQSGFVEDAVTHRIIVDVGH
jgi:hypothetical protein